MSLKEKTLKENIIFEGRIFTVRKDEIQLPNGHKSTREVAYHNGGVCVAPLTENNELIVVEQFRYPYKEILTEIPAGKLEKGEDPYDAGMRELEEETGYVARELKSLGKFYPTPGYCSEVIHIYYADELEFKKQNLDEGEFLQVGKIKLEDAVKMVMNGEIRDGKTQTAILKLALIKGVKI